MADQVAITITADIRSGDVVDLKTLLAEMNGDPAQNRVLPFGKLLRVHFARLIVLDGVTDLRGQLIPASLVFLSDVDGSASAYLGELVQAFGSGIDRIFRHCVGYPGGESVKAADQLAYLRAKTVQASAVYVNTLGRTAIQVRREARLREEIENFLDRWHGLEAARPGAVRAALRAFVRHDSSLAWAEQPAKSPGVLFQLREWLHFGAVILLLLLFSPLFIIGLPFWLIVLRLHELSDPAPDIRPDRKHVRELTNLEDFVAQNQFTAVGLTKPGRLRQLTALAILWLLNTGLRHLYSRGSLAGVKTIHFARWVFLNDKRRLLFASNYDGSLESYMDDFIDRLAWGLNAVFSNGVGYPKTRWLVFDGAKNEQAFKHFLRVHQVPTQFWYSAYNHVSAVNTANNAAIRAGLSGRMDDASLERWLLRL